MIDKMQGPVGADMRSLTDTIKKWTVFFRAIALIWLPPIIATAIVFGLSSWPPIESWLANQSAIFTLAFYLVGGIAAYVAACIVMAIIIAQIHYALDPAYATERENKRRVKQLQVGQRIRVADAKGEARGTITRVDPSGEASGRDGRRSGSSARCEHRTARGLFAPSPR